MLSNLRRFAVRALFASGTILLLSGCEDPQARADAAKAASDVAQLKAQLQEAAAKSEAVTKELKAIHDALDTKLNTKLDGLGRQAVENVNSEVARLKLEYDKNIAVATANGEENERKRAAAKVVDNKPEIMETIRLLREEVQKSHDLLQKYMDNQLKELYPYAYQPRRMDPAVPPGAEPK
jgi:outer membrane murein-binding lipoprotein Lpp